MRKKALAPINRKLIAQIAEEEGLFPKQVENIVLSQFEYMQKIMPTEHANQFKIPYLGKFRVTDKAFAKRKKHLDDNYGST